MKRQFFRHGLVYGAASVIAGAGNILLVPIYTQALTPGEYGVVDYVYVAQTLIHVCAGLEITQGIARFYASAGTEQERRQYASTGLLFLLSSVAAICLLLYLADRFFRVPSLGLGSAGPLLGLALLSVYVRILLYALQGQLRWELRSDLYSLASLLAVVSTIGLSAYLLLARRAGLEGVFVASSVGYGVACGFCVLALRRTYRVTFDAYKLRDMLRFSLPLTVSALALFFASYGDRLILRSQLGFHELGIYGIAARFAAVVTLAINGFQLGAAPLIYRHYHEPGTPATLAQMMRLVTIAGSIVVVGLASFSIELVQVFTTSGYQEASMMIPVLALAFLVGSLYTFVPGLTVMHLTTRFALINVVNAGISLVLVAQLVRTFGVTGAAAGTAAGATCGFLLHANASQRVYPIPLDWRRFGSGLAVTLLAIAACSTVGAPGAISLALRTSCCAGAVVALLWFGLRGDDRALVWRAVGAGLLEARRLVALESSK